jgi:hypothetical protein
VSLVLGGLKVSQECDRLLLLLLLLLPGFSSSCQEILEAGSSLRGTFLHC